ncbi:MAG: hypothetical protein AB7F97_09145 [Solirubrobacterales bacterium]
MQVSRIERGVREVRLTTLLRLMKTLGLLPNRLLQGTVRSSTPPS